MPCGGGRGGGRGSCIETRLTVTHTGKPSHNKGTGSGCVFRQAVPVVVVVLVLVRSMLLYWNIQSLEWHRGPISRNGSSVAQDMTSTAHRSLEMLETLWREGGKEERVVGALSAAWPIRNKDPTQLITLCSYERDHYHWNAKQAAHCSWPAAPSKRNNFKCQITGQFIRESERLEYKGLQKSSKHSF